MAKGYEFAKDQYVMFSPEELKALEEAGTHTADITEFVPSDSIDPVYFDKAYYLAPDKGGAKPYALLARALRDTKRCALGRWAARGKQYIVMIRPVEDGLVMQQLLYAGEVRSIKEIEIPKTEVKDAELKLAQQLIEQQASEKFDPDAYKDDVRERIEAAVQKKVEGQEITMPEEPEGTGQVIDLMDALRGSQGAAKTHCSLTQGAPTAVPGYHADVGSCDQRRRRSRRGQGGGQPLAGRFGAVPAGVRGRSGRRRSERDGAARSTAAGRVRARSGTRRQGSRRRPRSISARDRGGSGAPGRAPQSGPSAARRPAFRGSRRG